MAPIAADVDVTILDATGTALQSLALKLDSKAGAQGRFQLLDNAVSGGYEVRFRYKDQACSSAFRVAEYIKPHFEISLNLAKQGYSSNRQRVASRPASAEARRIAAWTSDLILVGTNVTYHLTQPDADKLPWEQAVEQANAGQRYDAILSHAYPRASLSRWDNPVASCTALPDAQEWLQ